MSPGRGTVDGMSGTTEDAGRASDTAAAEPASRPSSSPQLPPEQHLTLRGFWASLPTPGRWLLSTTAVSTLGRGMTLPFTIIYLHEVRGIDLDVAGLLMSLIAVVALVVTGPVGALIDRLGSRVVLIWGNVAQSSSRSPPPCPPSCSRSRSSASASAPGGPASTP
jgi:Major Facilitator Superfamily